MEGQTQIPKVSGQILLVGEVWQWAVWSGEVQMWNGVHADLEMAMTYLHDQLSMACAGEDIEVAASRKPRT